jgi:hypothetical protein
MTVVMDLERTTTLPASEYEVPVSSAGTYVGSAVSNLVYNALVTSAEAAASATESSIRFTGDMLGLGTDLVVGPLAGNAVRAAARGYGAVTKPVITTGAKLGAAGISVLAGTGAAYTATALLYGGRKISSYLHSYYVNYKKGVAAQIQYPVPDFSSQRTVICLDDVIDPLLNPLAYHENAYRENAYHETAYRENAYSETAYHENAYRETAYHENVDLYN